MRPERAVRTVADDVLRRHDPDDVAWNWGEGTLMAGMMRAHRLTGDDRYPEFVQEWADRHLADLGDRLARDHDYCGYWGPGFPVLQLYGATDSSDSSPTLVALATMSASAISDGRSSSP